MKFTCPSCQQSFEAVQASPDSPFSCPNCAHSFKPSEPAVATARARGKTPLFWVVLTVLLGLASLAAALFYLGNRSTAFKKGEKPGDHPSAAVSGLQVFPEIIDLSEREDAQSVIVQALLADGLTRDVTRQARIQLEHPSIARWENGLVKPVADGRTKVQIEFQGKSAFIPVTVKGSDRSREVSFKLDVIPVLMKAGCNSGSCHGSSRGKDGFRLSLFGYDPEGDYFRLTREQIGRRVNLAAPEESLLLEKATGLVPHTGGERFTNKSPHYQTLLHWLENGAMKDKTNLAKVVSVEIMPRQAVLAAGGAGQKLTVRARYSDDSDRDVTSLAVFISNNDATARVSDGGDILPLQRGEAFVMARFDTFTVGSQVLVVPKGSRNDFPPLKEENYIDTLVHAKLKKLRLNPSEVCDDATFVRRVYLDIIGLLPSASEVAAFVEDQNQAKRRELVDRLLERKEFADLWVMKWSERLQIRSDNNQVSPKSAHLYFSWLREKMINRVPINQVVAELLTTSGTSFNSPAANYFQIERDTLKTAENVAQVFLGMRIQCAQCHNHPFDRWTMDDYYGFSAFFSQVGRKGGEDPRETVIFDKKDGEVKHPVGGRVMKPKFLAGEAPEVAGEPRRAALARWLTSSDNPFFARNMANMIWDHFFGLGIIEPVDDVRVSNPPSNPELLDALSAHLVDYGYDFRRLVRDICASRTYQLSTRPNKSNEMDERNFSKASIRRLPAEVLLDCINQVTDSNDKFSGLPRGARAVQIADGNVSSYFLTTFGRSTRATVCSCEVRTEPNLSQALHLMNGSTTQGKIQDGGLIRKWIKEKKSPELIIDELYLRCFARKPTIDEKAQFQKFLTLDSSPEEVMTDLFWALLNSKEFLFNH